MMKLRLSIVIVAAVVSLALVIAIVYKKNPMREGFESKRAILTWYMADWCGHCKNMKPVWEKLAEKVDPTRVELKVVKDGEPGAKEAIAAAGVDGFPTIHLQKPGAKDPLVYSGPRTVEGLLQFVQ